MTTVHKIWVQDPHGEYFGPLHDSELSGLVWDPDADEGEEGHWSAENEDKDDEIEMLVADAKEALGGGLEDWGALWAIEGDLHALHKVWIACLADLVTPAWDWYGMGGDDHCYDYWPNSMTAMIPFRDQLQELMRSDAELGHGDEGAKKVGEELARVYWLVRHRYAADQAEQGRGAPALLMKGSPARDEADEYFETDILTAEEFGPWPIGRGWLAR